MKHYVFLNKVQDNVAFAIAYRQMNSTKSLSEAITIARSAPKELFAGINDGELETIKKYLEPVAELHVYSKQTEEEIQQQQLEKLSREACTWYKEQPEDARAKIDILIASSLKI